MRAIGSRIVRPSRAVTRSRISPAARRLKVNISMFSTGTPRSTRSTTASTSVVVLPVPGPANTSNGPPRCSTTARCAGSSSGATATGRDARTRR